MFTCSEEEVPSQKVEVDEGDPDDAMLLTGRFPTDGANLRGGLSAIPLIGSLGLEESCKLALDIGKPDKQRRILPNFRPLIEQNPTCCFSDLVLKSNIGYKGVDLAVGKIARVCGVF